MNPCTHGQFGDEDVAAFGKQDWSLGRYHLHLRIRFHYFFDAGQRQLVDLVVMSFGLQVGYGLLPISGKNIPILAVQALVDVCPCW